MSIAQNIATRGSPPRRILIVDNVLSYGESGQSRERLARSDLGTPLYLIRLNGGVRVRGQPIVFPDGSRKLVELADLSSTVAVPAAMSGAICRDKANGQLCRSKISGGRLISFDM